MSYDQIKVFKYLDTFMNLDENIKIKGEVEEHGKDL